MSDCMSWIIHCVTFFACWVSFEIFNFILFQGYKKIIFTLSKNLAITYSIIEMSNGSGQIFDPRPYDPESTPSKKGTTLVFHYPVRNDVHALTAELDHIWSIAMSTLSWPYMKNCSQLTNMTIIIWLIVLILKTKQ